MIGRVAVVTDAVSPEFIFPIWHRYYANLFGAENLFLITYSGLSPLFAGYKLGGLIELPVGYDDNTRRDAITRFVSTLLSCYQTVVRVDADEFLVVDPRISPSLSAFIDEYKGEYLTARGFDVIQMPEEPVMAVQGVGTLLKDRGYAYPNSSLNKTCLVRSPISWSTGFHWASVFPKFGPLFMLHMKRVDISWQLSWFDKMSQQIKDNPNVDDSLREYYAPDEAKIRDYHTSISKRPRLSGLISFYRQNFIAGFLHQIQFIGRDGLYYGEHNHEQVLCEIPAEWKALI